MLAKRERYLYLQQKYLLDPGISQIMDNEILVNKESD